MKDNIFARMVSKIRASMSNNSLRWKLYQAVSELEPGVQYIDDEDVEAKTVRYVVMICFGYMWDDTSEREYHTYQRTFSTDAENNVTVNDDRVELIYDEEKAWVIKPADTSTEAEMTPAERASESASESAPEPSKPCNCPKENKGETVMANVTTTTAAPAITAPTTAQKTLASQLITSTAAPFEESDRVVLEAMSEEKLGKLVKSFEAPAIASAANPAPAPNPNPAPVVATVTADPNSVTITREEYAVIKAAADAHANQVAARKAHLVSSLKTAQDGFTEADLSAMSVNNLEKLAVAFKLDTPAVADYSLRGVPESSVTMSAADQLKKHRPTDTWAAARAKRDQIKQQTNKDAN